MILSFFDKQTEKLWNGERVPKFQKIEAQAIRRLDVLHAAVRLEDLRLTPGNHFEALTGKRKGQYSIRINRQYRVCFGWKPNPGVDISGSPGDAIDVEIADYH